MNTLDIAMRFAGMTGADLAAVLDVTPQQVTNWKTGLRTPSRANADAIAAALDVDPAWILGVQQPLAVRDGAKSFQAGIIRTEEIPGYGCLYHVYLDATGDIVPVILADGVQLTPTDWQALTVRSAADVPDASWMTAAGVDAAMVGGLPRVLA